MRKYPGTRSAAGLIAVTLLAALIAGCGDDEVPPPRVHPITVLALQRSAPSSEAALTGSAEPYRNEDVGFEVGGRLEFVLDVGHEVNGASFDEGGKIVTKGDVIATVDDSRYGLKERALVAQIDAAKSQLAAQKIDVEQVARGTLDQARAQLKAKGFDVDAAQRDVEAAQANLKLATEELRRETSLLSTGSGTQSDVDAKQRAFDTANANKQKADSGLSAQRSGKQAQEAVVKTAESTILLKESEVASTAASIKQLEQEHAAAEKDLEDCTLRAPFNGRITRVHAARGAVVAAGQHVVTLTLMDPIKVAVAVSADTDRQVSWGDPVTVHPTEVGGERSTLKAFIFEKGEVADPATRTFRVDLIVRNQRRRNFPHEGDAAELPVVKRLLPTATRYFGEGGTLFIPCDAILSENGKASVLRVLKEGQAGERRSGRYVPERVPVELGEKYMTIVRWNFRSIKAGGDLQEGDLLVNGPTLDHLKGVVVGRHVWLIRPGDLIPVVFTLRSVPPGFYVPVDAVRRLGDQYSVFVVTDGRVKRVAVTPRESYGSERRIEGGELKEGAEIVVKGVHLLDDGDRVTVTGREGPR